MSKIKLSSKAAQYLRDLDIARTQSNWSSVPEWARKVTKHSPPTEPYAVAATIEAEIQSALLSNGVDFLSPKAITFAVNLTNYEQQLRNLCSSNTLSVEQGFINKTVLCHVLFLSQKYEEAVEISLSVLANPSLSDPADFSSAYTHVVSIKHRAIIGTAFEALSQFDKAIEYYETVAKLINDSISASSEALFWAEQLYSRFAMLATSYKYENNVISFAALRGYERISNILSKSPKAHAYYSNSSGLKRRVTILNIHFLYSSAFLQNNPSDQNIRKEVENLSNLFQSILFESSEASRSTDSNGPIERFLETLFQNWIKTMRFSIHLNQVYIPEDVAETKKLLALLRRAAVKTFHSCAIMRHLVFVLAALGQYDEALMAFETYTAYQDKARVQKAKMSKSNSSKNQLTVPDTDQPDASFGDDEKSVLKVFKKALDILVHVKYDGRKSREIADRLCVWLSNDEFTSTVMDITTTRHSREKSVSSLISNDTSSGLSSFWGSVARAYTLFGFQCFTAPERESAFDLAVKAFEKSMAFKNVEPEVYSDYGLFLARNNNVLKAIEVTRKGLLIDSTNYAGWHLLALLLASLGEYDKATDVVNNAVNMIWDSKMNLTPREKYSLIQIKITQIAIAEASQGIDKALDMIPEVFVMFGELFSSPADMSEPDTKSPEEVRPRKSFASNRPKSQNVDNFLKPTSSKISFRPFSAFHRRSSQRHSVSPIPDKSRPATPKSNNNSTKKEHKKFHSVSIKRPTTTLAQKYLAEIWVWTASMYRRANLYLDSEEALIEAENINGPTLASQIELGLLIREKRPIHALEEFESVLEKDSNNLKAIIALSQLILSHCGSNVNSQKGLKSTSEQSLSTQNLDDPIDSINEEENYIRDYSSDEEESIDEMLNEDYLYDKPLLSRPASDSSNSSSDGKIGKHETLFLSIEDEKAAISRASGLLENAVQSGFGFNSSEAWWLRAKFLEKCGNSQGAIEALWKSVGLEESRSVRDYTSSRWNH